MRRKTGVEKLRIVIADDSRLARQKLRQVLESDASMEVVGEAHDGPEALSLVRALRPDLVTMDIEMPGLDGFDAIARIMASHPVPILVVTASAQAKQADMAFAAVARGALDLALKKDLGDAQGAERFREHARRLARVPVVRHLKAARIGRSAQRASDQRACGVIGVAASAGGPASLAALLSRLDEDFGACLAIVQHLAKSFERGFVSFLQSHSRLPVLRVEGPTPISAGIVYVACADRHLVAKDRRTLAAIEGPPVDGFCPSASVLFDSLSQQFGPSATGIVLSGMGRDGASGLARIRERGGLTIAQSAESATVDGMPRAAREMGAAKLTLSLEEIAQRLPSLARAPAHHAVSGAS